MSRSRCRNNFGFAINSCKSEIELMTFGGIVFDGGRVVGKWWKWWIWRWCSVVMNDVIVLLRNKVIRHWLMSLICVGGRGRLCMDVMVTG